jgi:hypothetical protein
MDLKKAPSRRIVLSVFAVVAVLCTLVLIGPAPEAPSPVAQPQFSVETLMSEQQTQEKVPAGSLVPDQWGRDPFALPAGAVLARQPKPESQVGKEKPEEKPPLRVKAVVVSGTRQVAVIDEKIVGVGDQINDERVESITLDQVVLSSAAGQRVLDVPKPEAKVTTHPAQEYLAP